MLRLWERLRMRVVNKVTWQRRMQGRQTFRLRLEYFWELLPSSILWISKKKKSETFKNFAFGQKESSTKIGAYKHETKERFTAKKISILKTQGWNRWTHGSIVGTDPTIPCTGPWPIPQSSIPNPSHSHHQFWASSPILSFPSAWDQYTCQPTSWSDLGWSQSLV